MTPQDCDIFEPMVRRGLPQRTLRAAFAATETHAIKLAMAAKEDLVVLSGVPGVGKSVAAALWLLDRGKRKPECVRWVQSGELARGYAYDKDAFDSITNVFALVIDDFGVEYLDEKDRYLSTLEEILSLRYARERRTLLTTNLAPGKFTARYGERIVSRIKEDGAFLVCDGEDLRRNRSNT